MSDCLIGKSLQFAMDYLDNKGISYSVSIDDSNPDAQQLIVVRISDAYHLVAMGMKTAPTD